jgi:glucose/mannose-6-phosphate isomerase
MNILDNKNTIKKYDTGRVLESLKLLPAQISDTKRKLEGFSLPADYKNVNKIILCGMGGSALGAQLLKAAFFDSIKVPLEIVNDYRIPGSLDNNALYILSSYSGGTEEPLSTLDEAKKRNAKILGLAAGGKLAELLKKNNLPVFIFETQNNPSGQPRLGLGYAALALWGILAKLNLIAAPDWDKILAAAKSATKQYDFDAPANDNCAKWLAKEMSGKIPVLVTHGFLNGWGTFLPIKLTRLENSLSDALPSPS